tara:strand:- start:142 stop:555 length:414 start_codon:yes stop_codon:yes gene_type:complete
MLYHSDNIHTESQINILPMIDIIFAILSFLIVSSLYLTRVDTIPVDLPKASSSIREDKKFITVTIDKFGNLFINRNKILFDELEKSLINLISQNSKIVVLNADKNVSHGVVIKVLDLLRSVEGLKIAISTKSAEKSS